MILHALLVAALPAQEAAAPILPPAPEGWRHERLAFPLDFAPDIELEGYEELRFAPGMFDPGSRGPKTKKGTGKRLSNKERAKLKKLREKEKRRRRRGGASK